MWMPMRTSACVCTCAGTCVSMLTHVREYLFIDMRMYAYPCVFAYSRTSYDCACVLAHVYASGLFVCACVNKSMPTKHTSCKPNTHISACLYLCVYISARTSPRISVKRLWTCTHVYKIMGMYSRRAARYTYISAITYRCTHASA